MNPSDAQVIGGFLVLIVLLVNFGITSNNRRLERADDAARRAQDKADRVAQDQVIKDEVRRQATEIADRLRIQNDLTQALAKLAHLETLEHIGRATTAANEAYTEANHVNIKIADTNRAIEGLQADLQTTLTKIPDNGAAAAAAAAPSSGQISGTFVGTPDK